MFDVECGGAEVLRIIKFIWTLMDGILFLVPMILIVMVMIDFVKNVVAGREDDMKKNLNLAIKRIVFCVVLFLVEPICSVAVGLLGNTVDVNWAKCIDIAIDPNTNFNDYEIDFNKK